MASGPEYLQSASALIKSLRASNDPPVSPGPSKAQIALEAWNAKTFDIPRKAEILRDWILETWSKARANNNNNAILKTEYHSLLLRVGKTHDLASPAPLQILSTFFSSLQQNENTVSLLRSAAKSFAAIFDPQEITYKTESWVDAWTSLVQFLSLPSFSAQQNAPISTIAGLIASGIERSQYSNTSAKKNAQAANAIFPVYCQAFLAHAYLRNQLNDTLSSIIFNTAVLQASEPLGGLFSAAEPKLNEAAVAHGCLLALPTIFKSLTSTYHQDSSTLFAQPSSSKLPHDVFVASKERDSVRQSLDRVLVFLETLETRLQNFPASSEVEEGMVWLWESRAATWKALADWGGYMEREEPWGRLVDATARRIEAVLSNFNTQPTATNENFLRAAIQTLSIIEKVDHDRTNIGPDLMRWVIAAPTAQSDHTVPLLSSIIRYHQLTHTLPSLFELLNTTVEGFFDPSIPDQAVPHLYKLVICGPLGQRAIREDFVSALKTTNPGKRRSPQWTGIFTALASSLQALTEPSWATSSGQLSARSAALTGIKSRWITRCIEAVVDTTYDGEIEGDVVSDFATFLDKWAQAPLNISGRANDVKTEAGGVNSAARLRLTIAVEKLLNRSCTTETGVDAALTARTANRELLLALTKFSFHRAALNLQLDHKVHQTFPSELDAIVEFCSDVEQPAFDRVQHSSKSNAPGNVDLWQIVVDNAAIIDLVATPKQLKRFAMTVIRAAHHNSSILSNAGFWELDHIQTGVCEGLSDYLKEISATQLVAFLERTPPNYLSKHVRTAAADALWKHEDLDQGVHFLSIMAEYFDYTGPVLSDDTIFLRLVKIAEKPNADGEYARKIWSKILPRLLKAPLQYSGQFDTLFVHHLDYLRAGKKPQDRTFPGKLEMIARTAQQAMAAGPLESFPSTTRTHFFALSEKLVAIIPSLFNNTDATLNLSHLVPVYVVARQFARWSGVPVSEEKAGLKLAPGVARLRVQDAGKATRGVLELLLDEGEGLDQVLAVTVVFYTVLPGGQLDEIVRETFKDHIDEAMGACIHLLQANSGREEAIIGALRAMTKACNKPELIRQVIQTGISSAPSPARAISFVESIVEDKFSLLQTDDALLILSALYEILFTPIGNETFTSIINILTIIDRRRPELVFATLPQIVQTVCYIFPRFQVSRAALLQGSAERPLSAASSTLFARYLVSLAQSKPSRADNPHETSPLAKHVPAILVAYVRACSDPTKGYEAAVRKELEIGLFALCDLTTSGGRAGARGREGEGLGTPFGLGEGPGGEGERELWAELWKGWSRGRYAGQG
ncbi:hypothetical protein L202_01169 [Cryptococcus amylolentus CBS 6039]|uniref:Nucleolar 27S pre-rRNA processing Urb2/Npa2 C-terminal domain-containing protein n=1 Tax=Cryptococcus amylolentus CBS 6039 TaxID=1295533 RepID=A0A1E3I4Z8_9TREE|nr:hypothetical protein L202_01169 [Cryptococcus amylolentus CBS 6039]ODN82921.1 hypothetical protein L202_01169 [Cryptococcus amylolentus CBS 6039]